MKSVQIPEELFFALCRYHLLADQLDELDGEELEREIETGLMAKLDAMRKRAAYTAYKDKSLSPAEREAARQQYLDLVGMLPDWRWDSLEPPV